MGVNLRLIAGLLAATPALSAGAEPNERRQDVILVVGAAGAEEYGSMFTTWADKWRDAAERAGANIVQIGRSKAKSSDRQQLRNTLEAGGRPDCELIWIVLLGHGTYDGTAAKFNLRGPDVTAAELSDWVTPLDTPTVIINCASSSGPFVNVLAAEDRVVISAAKSGFELNFARFGGFLADAITDPAADLDKDDQVSLLEAYLTACRRVNEYYENDDRLVTEHALLDDNGDGLGTPASWFRGLRATQRAESGAELDGTRAHQVHLLPSSREANMPRKSRDQRDNLERQLATLREQKVTMDESEYFAQLEELMLKLARLYHGGQEADDLSVDE